VEKQFFGPSPQVRVFVAFPVLLCPFGLCSYSHPNVPLSSASSCWPSEFSPTYLSGNHFSLDQHHHHHHQRCSFPSIESAIFLLNILSNMIRLRVPLKFNIIQEIFIHMVFKSSLKDILFELLNLKILVKKVSLLAP
jgi:hypothetical protein